jgi:hypothetical protein
MSDRGGQQAGSDDEDAYKTTPHFRAPSFLTGVMALFGGSGYQQAKLAGWPALPVFS